MALSSGEYRQIVERRCQIRMLRSQKLFLDLERPTVEPLGLIDIANVFTNDTEVAAHERHLDGIGPVDFLLQRQRHPVQRLRQGVLPLHQPFASSPAQSRDRLTCGRSGLESVRHGADSIVIDLNAGDRQKGPSTMTPVGAFFFSSSSILRSSSIAFRMVAFSSSFFVTGVLLLVT